MEKVTNMEYIKAQEAWIKENNIKVGDKVFITKRTVDFKRGWDNTWETVMCEFVGTEQSIILFENERGILLSNGFRFPFFVLEKVNNKVESATTSDLVRQASDAPSFSAQSDYAARQAKWIRKHNLKVGDEVRVCALPTDNYVGGWNGISADIQETCLFYYMRIESIHPIFGIYLRDKKNYTLEWFPFFCLEPVKPVESKKTINIPEGTLIFHWRNEENPQKGGLTAALVVDDIAEEIIIGFAFCSKKDNFSRKIGVEVALNDYSNYYEETTKPNGLLLKLLKHKNGISAVRDIIYEMAKEKPAFKATGLK